MTGLFRETIFVLGRLESQGLKTNFLILLVTDFNLCTWSFLTQGGLTATFKAEYMGSQTSPLPTPAYSEAPQHSGLLFLWSFTSQASSLLGQNSSH